MDSAILEIVVLPLLSPAVLAYFRVPCKVNRIEHKVAITREMKTAGCKVSILNPLS
jgi:hypothetical protein